MAILIRVNDRVCADPLDAHVSIFDHGFLFGDSVYEVVRTYGRKPFQLDEHLERLFQSADQISLDLGCSKEILAEQMCELVDQCPFASEAYVRVIVTRGVGDCSIDPATCGSPTRIIVVKDLAEWPSRLYQTGVALRVVSTIRNQRGSVDPSMKTGNYLNSVLALIEARKLGADEAVMCNSLGYLAECTTSNLFVVRDGALKTPALGCGILGGITRHTVIAACNHAGLSCEEGELPVSLLRTADEAFITSTTRGVMPIGQVDGERLPNCPGPITTLAQQALEQEVERQMGPAR